MKGDCLSSLKRREKYQEIGCAYEGTYVQEHQLLLFTEIGLPNYQTVYHSLAFDCLRLLNA